MQPEKPTLVATAARSEGSMTELRDKAAVQDHGFEISSFEFIVRAGLAIEEQRMAISIRPAILRDVPKLAEYFLASTGGGIEWLYKGVLPDRPTNIIVEHLFTRFGSAWVFTNC